MRPIVVPNREHVSAPNHGMKKGKSILKKARIEIVKAFECLVARNLHSVRIFTQLMKAV